MYEPFLSLQRGSCPLAKATDPVLSVHNYIVNLHIYFSAVEHLHASLHLPERPGRRVKPRSCFISSNEDSAKILETPIFSLSPLNSFVSAPWANWNRLSVNWMSGDVCWDCDLWPTFGTCATCSKREMYGSNAAKGGLIVHWTWARGSFPRHVSSQFRISHFTRQTTTISSTAAHYSTVVLLHGWVNPSGPAVFAQRSGWTAQEGLNASYSTRCYVATPTISQATRTVWVFC